MITHADQDCLDSQALTLLQNLLIAGSSSSQPAFVPPPLHLSLILTLAIHPSLNTRAKRPDLLKASNLAIQYLHTLNRTVGPANARISEGFRFSKSSAFTSRRSGSNVARRKHPDSPTEDNAEIDNTIHTDLAQGGSLFAQVDDFWAAVGFAFNCSVAYGKRWERWHLWLSYMLSVLEDDWALADAEDEENDSYERRKESLLAKFASGRESERRIMRAVFADGSSSSLNEFPEIWKNECRERREKEKSTPRPSKKTKINLEEGEFGERGFLSSSSSDEDEDDLPSSPLSPSTSPPSMTYSNSTTLTTFPDGSLALGGTPALALRMRLLSLLSTLATALPSTFTPLSSLYSLSLDRIRPLALPTFLSLLTPQSLSPFAPDVASSLVQYVARSLLEAAAPASSLDELDWGIFEVAYAPYAAAGEGKGGVVGENGKVGVCVEALLGMLVREVGVLGEEREGDSRRHSLGSQESGFSRAVAVEREKVSKAVREGCERRLERARKGGRRSRKGEAGAKRDWEEERRVELGYLEGAWERMSSVLGVEEEK